MFLFEKEEKKTVINNKCILVRCLSIASSSKIVKHIQRHKLKGFPGVLRNVRKRVGRKGKEVLRLGDMGD